MLLQSMPAVGAETLLCSWDLSHVTATYFGTSFSWYSVQGLPSSTHQCLLTLVKQKGYQRNV